VNLRKSKQKAKSQSHGVIRIQTGSKRHSHAWVKSCSANLFTNIFIFAVPTYE